MVVLGLEKDSFGVTSGGTLAFADRTGLELVVDDSDHLALEQFFSPNRGEGTNNSDFVILNGVANSSSHELWEVVYSRSFRPSVQGMRDAIDSIEAGAPALPPAQAPRLSDLTWENGAFSFSVLGTAGYTGSVEVSTDGIQWNVLQGIEFDGENQRVTDTDAASRGHRLYRVVSSE